MRVEQGLAIALVGLVEEVLVADGDVVERLVGEELRKLLVEVLGHLARRAVGGVVADRRGEQAHIAELVGIVGGNHAGVAAAHGQAADRAVGAVRNGPVGLLDKAHHVAEGRLVGVRLGAYHAAALGAVVAAAVLARSGGHADMAVRHHHDHRHGLAGGDQVVHDLGRTAQVEPLVLVAATAVQQVQHRIFLVSGSLVAIRRIDAHAAVVAEGGRVPDLGHGAVRHVLYHGQVAHLARHHEHVAQHLAVTDGVRRSSVDRVVAVDDELIAVELALGRHRGVGPQAVGILRHLGDALAEGAVLQLEEVAAHLHGLGVRGGIGEGDRPVGIYLHCLAGQVDRGVGHAVLHDGACAAVAGQLEQERVPLGGVDRVLAFEIRAGLGGAAHHGHVHPGDGSPELALDLAGHVAGLLAAGGGQKHDSRE